MGMFQDFEGIKKRMEALKIHMIINSDKKAFHNLSEDIGRLFERTKSIEQSLKDSTDMHKGELDELMDTHNQLVEVVTESYELSVEVERLKANEKAQNAQIKELKNNLQILYNEIVSLKEKNACLQQELAKVKRDYQEKKEQVVENKEDLKEKREESDLIVLGDFAFQFQNLLAKFIGVKFGLQINQLQAMLTQNSLDEVYPEIKKIKDFNFVKPKSLENLEACLRNLKELRFPVGHKAIATKSSLKFKGIMELSKTYCQYHNVEPIVEAWKKLMIEGEVFDDSTWKLRKE